MKHIRLELVMLGLALVGIIIVIVFLVRADQHAREANYHAKEANRHSAENNRILKDRDQKYAHFEQLIIERCGR
ncbi:MAG TPA: hypothetical protein VJS44_08305 [Pyrinomonadaceae bacterium]|nr:hypothetical protein [Pyrinomonadaceae bacterium]